ncbi:MAG: radical SAM protein [Elusimicrobia bacterium]|nr:radical SAM protein [Elusimicrobiota bacterium]
MPVTSMRTGVDLAEPLAGFRRRLAETLVRSGLNFRDDLRVLDVLLNKARPPRARRAGEILSLWKAMLAEPTSRERPFQLYINIPYCRQKCLFCKFPVRLTAAPDGVESYLRELEAEALFFAPTFDTVRFDDFCVGGGTPSVCSARQLRDLFASVRSSFQIDPGARCSIEFHPASTTLEKLLVVRRAGFNRVSFGVQTMDAALLARIQRDDQDEASVRDAVRRAREAGFDNVSLELVLGLLGDGPRQFMESFRRVAALRPTTISVNQLNLTAAYMKSEGVSPDEYRRHCESVLPETVAELRTLAPAFGYDAGEASPRHGIWTLYALDALELRERKALAPEEATTNVLGLGQYAWSHVFARAWYERLPRAYHPDRPIYRTHPLSRGLEMARYVRDRLIKRSRIDFPHFRSLFGEDFRDRYALELRLLDEFGKVRMDSYGVDFLPLGLPERFFYGSVFFLDQISSAGFGRRTLSEGYLARLQRDLGCPSSEYPARAQ